MNALQVVVDGWNLAYAPNSPAALHLLAVLANLPPETRPVVAIPAEPPEWVSALAPLHLFPIAHTPRGRLSWEQVQLPRLARQLGAHCLHLPGSYAPLLPGGLAIAAEAGAVPSPPKNITTRWSAALGQGGLSRLDNLFWPEDLPPPQNTSKLLRLPALVHPLFTPARRSGFDNSEPFVLYHGSLAEGDFANLLAAWSWAARGPGSDYPLYIIGASLQRQPVLDTMLREANLGDSVRILPPQTLNALAALYHHCTAFFHPIPAAGWGDPLRHALACNIPVAACADPLSAALAGPAAYLSAAEDARKLGAAILTLIVEPVVAENLCAAAQIRTVAWKPTEFGGSLSAAYQRVIHHPGA